MGISVTAFSKGLVISMTVAGLVGPTLGANGALAGNTTHGPVQEIGSKNAGLHQNGSGPPRHWCRGRA